MWNVIMSVLFGIVEGITEWLPISSTGHLILVKEFIDFRVSDEFWSMYEVVIQLGAIMAVVVLFWTKLWPFSMKEKYFIKQDKFVMWFKIAFACIPAIIVKVVLGDQMEELFYNYQSIAIALIVFGIAFIIIENRNKHTKPRIKSIAHITYQTAFIIGIFQVIAAVFPGTSRSGATIVGAILIGVSRSVAAEFTFFLAIPAMFGASLMELMDFGMNFTKTEISLLLIGMVVSFLVSVVVIRFLMSYIKKHDFKAFGWYRIVLGILVIVYFGFIK